MSPLSEKFVYFFNQCALVNQSLILEANFRGDEIARVKDIADEYHYQVLLIKVVYNDRAMLIDILITIGVISLIGGIIAGIILLTLGCDILPPLKEVGASCSMALMSQA